MCFFRYPTYFDDITAHLLPVIPLIIYRLIENDATEAADSVLQLYSSFLHYYPLNFTFVRDILAYFYGLLPGKLIFRILNVLDMKKVRLILVHIFPSLNIEMTGGGALSVNTGKFCVG